MNDNFLSWPKDNQHPVESECIQWEAELFYFPFFKYCYFLKNFQFSGIVLIWSATWK